MYVKKWQGGSEGNKTEDKAASIQKKKSQRHIIEVMVSDRAAVISPRCTGTYLPRFPFDLS